MIITIFLFIAGLLILWFGADRFIKGGRITAARMGISPLIVGLTFGAIGTSLPELIISWFASGLGRTSISIGNVVGSNMANIGLALGLGALIYPVPVEKQAVKYDYWVLLGSAVLLYFFSANNVISGVEGILMVALSIWYIGFLAARHHMYKIPHNLQEEKRESQLKGLFYFVLGAVCLTLGARLVINKASHIAAGWGVTETVVGITIVALGTSLPEIAVVMAGSIKKVPEISLGTILGSNIFNILLIAGGASIINTIHLNPGELLIQAPAVIAMILLLLPVILLNNNINKIEGGLLVAVYTAYFLMII